jgi:phosphohistidine swiveling domain-containing protein
MPTLVASLSSRKAAKPSVSGGKGACLARLLKAGFPVPPGFVITTAAFEEPLASAARLIAPDDQSLAGRTPVPFSGNPQLDSNASGIKGLDNARRLCLGWDVPAALRRDILGAYRRFGGGPVAVRSSLVGEDAAAASCAGLLETVLDVRGEDALLDAVRRVLASVFCDRLRAYLDKTGAAGSTGPSALASASLAVVVQPMVKAAVSGVAFSVDPVTCRPGVVIEAAPGLGEDLVQGRVRPDRYRLGPRGGLDEAVPARPGEPLLDEPSARRLGELVRSIADFAEAPQDVEWAFDQRRFHVLQARPIASITGKPVYSRRMVSDMAPGLVKPLVWSAKYAPIVENVFAPVFERLAGPTGADYARLSARFYSRVYMNVTAFGELFKRIGLPPNFFYVLARDDKAARPKLRLRFKMARAVHRIGRFIWSESRIGRRVGPFLDSQNRRLDEFRKIDWAAQTPESLIARFGRLKALHGRSQWYVVLVSINMLVRSRMLGRMIVRRWPGTDPRDVIKGYGRRSSLVPFEGMRHLAGEARRLDRVLLERMAGDDGFDPAAALAATEPGRALAAGFDAFMDRFGFLSANGSDFSEVPWIENPRPVWRSVARLALSPAPVPQDSAEAHREEVLGFVRAGFGPLRRRLFDRLHASTVRYMDCRERVSLLMTEDSFWMRRCLLSLGGKLVERRAIAAADDIFFLFEDELEGVLNNPSEAAAAAVKIAARKAELAGHAAIDPPDTLCAGELPHLDPPTAEGLEFLSGIGASAGILKGRARVVHDPALDSGRLEPSDVLVVPFTDIGWIPVLAGIGGVVAETGGQLSHTSIIAREFGVPAVVSVGNATRLIRDGQLITIDGTAGRIYLHPE